MLAVMALLAALAAAGAWWLRAEAGLAVLVVGLLLLVWGIWFFRDPTRVAPAGPGLVVSPADGVVVKIDRVPLPKEVAGDAAVRGLAGAGEPMERIAIFLDLFSVHVNRVPAKGRIVKLAYVPGRFVNASFDKASEQNERAIAVMADDGGRAIGFVQIAGLVARRIVSHLREGQAVAAGERFGLIRFGSRAEVYVPAGTAFEVTVGQAVRAGETVLARLPVAGGVMAGSVDRREVSA